MTTHLRWIWLGTLIALFGGILTPTPAQAEWRGHGRGHENWHGGHWIHDRHGGRLGWWWVIGPAWYYYERPHTFIQPQTVYVQPAPPVVIQQMPAMPAPAPVNVVQAPPVTPVLYYCKATGTHYPETTTCPGGWATMTAETPPEP